MMQWNISYQRQIGKDWKATVNYLGNRTNHILGSYDVNPAVYIAGSTASTTGELAGTIYQNPNNRRGERGECGFDRRLNFNTSIVAASTGLGNAFTRKLTDGWQISPIFTAYTGQPFTITDGGRDISQSGQLQDRPNVVLPNAVIPDPQTLKAWFNPAAFAVQPAGTYGNLGRFALHGPGAWNMDLGLSRISASPSDSSSRPAGRHSTCSTTGTGERRPPASQAAPSARF